MVRPFELNGAFQKHGFISFLACSVLRRIVKCIFWMLGKLGSGKDAYLNVIGLTGMKRATPFAITTKYVYFKSLKIRLFSDLTYHCWTQWMSPRHRKDHAAVACFTHFTAIIKIHFLFLLLSLSTTCVIKQLL